MKMDKEKYDPSTVLGRTNLRLANANHNIPFDWWQRIGEALLNTYDREERLAGYSEKLVYLASPYFEDDKILELGYFLETEICLHRMTVEDGLKCPYIISPIVHRCSLAKFGFGNSFKLWQHFHEALLERCSQVKVLKLKGWQDSEGLQEEIAFAEGKVPISYVDPYERGWLQ